MNKNIAGRLSYNENKITQGKATCILAENFVKDTQELTHDDKLYHLRRLNELNPDVIKSSIHISLNFHHKDLISDRLLQKISKEYMQQLGLGEQPYLVYRHRDAAHPHVHLLTTKVTSTGNAIKLTRQDYYKSHDIDKAIEKAYHLIPSGSADLEQIQKQPVQKIEYGRTPLTPAMSRVLDHVMSNYQYTSMTEFNTLLRRYNMEAYQGLEGTRLRENHGLLYWALTENGKHIGSPIPASHFNSKPTLARLEEQFRRHQQDRESNQQQAPALKQTPKPLPTIKPVDYSRGLPIEPIEREQRPRLRHHF